MSLRIRLVLLATLSLTLAHWPAVGGAADAVDLFPLNQVRLLPGPFLDATHLNRDQLLRYDPDRLLAPYLEEAGLAPKAPRYGNWESDGLGGHTAGHYLSAIANTAATLDDQRCRERVDYMVSELARCQAAHGDGYVGGVSQGQQLWRELRAGEIDAGGFSLGNRWVPLYNLHKTYAGLRDAYLVAGNQQAKQVLIRLADWAYDLFGRLSDAQLQSILAAEHGGMNEVLADVAAITGDDKYLELAKRFSHRALLDPLAAGQDPLSGMHANTQAPKFVGFERIARLNGGERYHRAAVEFWENVTQQRSVAFGGNSVAEHFPSLRQSMRFIEERQGPETCNTYNMLRLTEQLFQAEPAAPLAAYYERAMLNHILSTQHPEHGGYVYFTPARPQHYRVYSQAEKAFWCCVGTGMENHTKYGQFIYAHHDDQLYVNLFLASRLKWDELGVVVEQSTRFPEQPQTRLTVKASKPVQFTMRLRCPDWVTQDGYRVSVNGDPHPTTPDESGYVAIDRSWQAGDVVEVALPMRTTVQTLPNLDDYVALMHGPVVLAAKTGADDLAGLVAGAGRMDHVAQGPLRPLDEAPMLVAQREDLPAMLEPVEGAPLTFTLADAIRPDRYDSLRLVPFYSLHDARYMMYWRLVSPQDYESERQRLRQQEQQRLALDRATIDRVAPGEQQPETEHNFQGEQTSTGVWQDRHFRHAEGWFSYDLQTAGRDQAKLLVTYFGSDRRRFDITANGESIAEVDLNSPDPGKFIDVTYELPGRVLSTAKDKPLTIKFIARPGSMAGGIYDVRLIADPTDQPQP